MIVNYIVPVLAEQFAAQFFSKMDVTNVSCSFFFSVEYRKYRKYRFLGQPKQEQLALC